MQFTLYIYWIVLLSNWLTNRASRCDGWCDTSPMHDSAIPRPSGKKAGPGSPPTAPTLSLATGGGIPTASCCHCSTISRKVMLPKLRQIDQREIRPGRFADTVESHPMVCILARIQIRSAV